MAKKGEREVGEERCKIKYTREFYESIVESVGFGVLTLDADGNIVCFNKHMKVHYGWDDDYIGKNIFDLRGDLKSLGIDKRFRGIIRSKKHLEILGLRREHPKLGEIYQNFRAYPFVQNGKVEGVVVIIEDVTERIKLEEELAETQEMYKSLFEYANDAIFIEDLEGNILDANRRACRMLGYTKRELLKKNVRDLVPEEIEVKIPEIIKRIRKRGEVIIKANNKKKDGSLIDVEVRINLIRFGDKEIVQTIVREIGERRAR